MVIWNESNEAGRARADALCFYSNQRKTWFFLIRCHLRIKKKPGKGPLTMERELNSPGEMLRRIAFIIYIGCWTAALVNGVLALLHLHPQRLLLTIPAIAICLAMKRGGERHLDFHRLARSFPLGEPADRLPHPLRKDVEELLQRLAVDGIDWQERHENRQQLRALLEKDPRLFSIFRSEIAARCPTLLQGAPPDA
jgi:hypothetical protein